MDVGDFTTLEGNHVGGSANDVLRVANNNDVVKNHIDKCGTYDLRIEGTGNPLDKNKFDSWFSAGDPCPGTP